MLHTPTSAAERYTKAVLVAQPGAGPRVLQSPAQPVIQGLRPPTERARRPANQLTEFLRRVVGRTGLDEDMAFVVSEAVVETLAERIARGGVDDLIEELPRDLRPRGNGARGARTGWAGR